MLDERLFRDLSAAPVVLLQLAVLVLSFRLLRSASRASKDLQKDLDDVCDAMDKIPILRAATLWYPRNVAVVASIYQISPAEVGLEYAKEVDAKKWIVNNTFPENGLTNKLAEGLSGTRFIGAGYDYGSLLDSMPTSRASSRSAAHGSSVNRSRSNTNLEKSRSNTKVGKCRSNTKVEKSRSNTKVEKNTGVAKSRSKTTVGKSKSNTNLPSSGASGRRKD